MGPFKNGHLYGKVNAVTWNTKIITYTKIN